MARENLLRPREAAAMLNISVKTMQRWRHEMSGPPFYRIARNAVRYDRHDLIQWMESTRVRPPIRSTRR